MQGSLLLFVFDTSFTYCSVLVLASASASASAFLIAHYIQILHIQQNQAAQFRRYHKRLL